MAVVTLRRTLAMCIRKRGGRASATKTPLHAPTLPPALSPGNHESVLQIHNFFIWRMLCKWIVFPPLRRMLLRSIQVVTCIINSFLVTAVVRMDHDLFNHSPSEGLLGWIQFGSTIENAELTVLVCVSLSPTISLFSLLTISLFLSDW